MTSGITYEAKGPQDGEALLFLHGVGGNAHAFDPQLDHFAGRYRAIAWNMPGYGGSHPLDRVTFEALATATGWLLDELGLERVHLIGHSIGGMIAQQFAATSPERLKSLVLSATTAAFGRQEGDFQRQFLEARLAPLDRGKTPADLAPGLVANLLGEDPDAAGVRQAIASMSAVPAESYRAALHCLVTFDRRDALESYRLPVLLIAGGRDKTAPLDVMRRMSERIPAARLAVIEKAGHLANLERPEEFNTILAAFLTDLSKG